MFCLRQFFWCSFFSTVIWFCPSETSLSEIIDVDHYLRMESSMISKGRHYVSQERNRLKSLETYLKVWGKWRKSYLNQESEYIAIPQNIFHLFKKLVLDLNQTEKFMMENSYKSTSHASLIILHGTKHNVVETVTMIPDTSKPPTEDHLKQVASSLVDLQNFYDLKSNEIMNGKLLDTQLNTSLAIDSCHFTGKTCLEYNKHLCACDWLNLWLSESPKDPHRRKEVFRSLYPTYIFLDQKDRAYNYASKYLGEDPFDVSAQDAKLDLSFTIGKLSIPDFEHLEINRLCRGDYDTRSHTIQSNLKCRYKHGDSAFLKIAPLKEEDLHDNPKILLYRDAIHDSEIERIKACSPERFKPAKVYGKGGKSHVTSFKHRLSETGFMNNRSPGLTMLSERIEDISDLLIDSGERWQLLSYSFGGHFSLHSDYLPEHLEHVKINGNRIASMLFYFNDVILGGETVFIRIGLPVKPIKGAVIIWYNTNRDGSRNFIVDHSACPVVIGEKWGFTQWFRAKNQITLRGIFDADSTTSSESIKMLRKLYTKTQGN